MFNIEVQETEQKPIFIKPKLDFKISPNHFIKWLKAEGETIEGVYHQDVSNMCEYSCLYIAMILDGVKLQNEPLIYYGRFGEYWEHYWIGYTFNNQEYFIDLTLQQFIPSVPKLAITKAVHKEKSRYYSHYSEGTPINQYLKDRKGFDFYTNPKTMEPPKYKVGTTEDFLNEMNQKEQFLINSLKDVTYKL